MGKLGKIKGKLRLYIKWPLYLTLLLLVIIPELQKAILKLVENIPIYVELAQEWRSDKMMRKLEAMLIAADKDEMLLVSGTGEVIEPDEGVLAIGSGGNFAYAAATALVRNTDLPAAEIAKKAMEIASEICVYTNGNITIEEV